MLPIAMPSGFLSVYRDGIPILFRRIEGAVAHLDGLNPIFYRNGESKHCIGCVAV